MTFGAMQVTDVLDKQKSKQSNLTFVPLMALGKAI